MTRRAVWLLLVAMLLSSCGVVKIKKPPGNPETGAPLKSMRFEDGDSGDTPSGWEVSSYDLDEPFPREPKDPPTHKLEYTDSQKRGGKMSVKLGPVGKQKLDLTTHSTAQLCGEAPFSGSPVTVSLFIKGSERVPPEFSVWHQGVRSPHVTAVKAGEGWKRLELASLPPAPDPEARAGSKPGLCLRFGVRGPNSVWIDDVTFTKLDLAGLSPDKIHPVALENLNMEQFDRRGNLTNWTLVPNSESGEIRPGYKLNADKAVKKGGAAALHLSNDEYVDEPPGDSAGYCVDPTLVLGKAVRVSGWTKLDVAEEGDGYFNVFASPVTRAEIVALSPEERRSPDLLGRGDSSVSILFLSTSQDWTHYKHVLFVPGGIKEFCIEIRMDGVGSIWADDLSVEVIDL